MSGWSVLGHAGRVVGFDDIEIDEHAHENHSREKRAGDQVDFVGKRIARAWPPVRIRASVVQ